MQRLMIKSGNRYRVASKAEIAEAFGALVLVEFNKVRPVFEGPDASARYLRDMLAGLDHEVFRGALPRQPSPPDRSQGNVPRHH
jgi:hypothetical protein